MFYNNNSIITGTFTIKEGINHTRRELEIAVFHIKFFFQIITNKKQTIKERKH